MGSAAEFRITFLTAVLEDIGHRTWDMRIYGFGQSQPGNEDRGWKVMTGQFSCRSGKPMSLDLMHVGSTFVRDFFSRPLI